MEHQDTKTDVFAIQSVCMEISVSLSCLFVHEPVPNYSIVFQYYTYFVKTLHFHTSNFSVLVTYNSKIIKDIAVKLLRSVKQ